MARKIELKDGSIVRYPEEKGDISESCGLREKV